MSILAGIGKLIQGGGKLIQKGGEAITPKTATEMAKKLGVDLKKFEGAKTSDIKKLLNKLGIKVGPTKTGTATKIGIGAGLTEGARKFGTDVGRQMEEATNKVKMNKGGIVAPKMGGKPTHKSKKSSKSIAKKYFKGTFQLVELTKAVKHILNKIDSEIESRKNAFADGKIIKENFEKSVGQVRGLVLAKEIVRETAKNIEELDD